MKKHLVLLFLFSLLLLTSCELFTEEPAKGKVNIVSVGLNYQGTNVNRLLGTINDATELQEALEKISLNTKRNYASYLMIQQGVASGSGITYETNLSDPDFPTKAHILARLSNLASDSQATESDLTIFTYSGHGGKDGSLLVAPPREDGTIYRTFTAIYEDCLLTVEELLVAMNTIPGKKLLLIDSCYSGQFVGESASSVSTVYANGDFYAKYFSDESYDLSNLYVLSASANNTESHETYFEEADHNHGYFTYALLSGLGWPNSHDSDLSTVAIASTPPAITNSALTVDGLYKYVIKHQVIPSSSFFFSHQHPMTNGGAMDMVLFNY